MRIALEQDGGHREVDLVVRSADACVADLLAAMGADAPGVVLDSRFYGRDLGLDELPLYEGALLRAGADDPAGLTPALPSAPGGPVLVITDGPTAGRVVALPRGELVLGRSQDCDLVLPDPTVSSRHAAITVGQDGAATVRDLGSQNGTWLDGAALQGPQPLRPGALLRLGASHARLWPRLPQDRPLGMDPLHRASGGLIPFNRMPRSALPPPARTIDPPPTPAEVRRGVALNVLAVLGPLVLGGVLIWLYRDPRYALFLLLSPLLLVGTWLLGRRRERSEGRATQRSFREAIARLGGQLEEAAAHEVRRLEALLPDAAETLRRAWLPSTRLWERRPGHRDFLRLRAGIGDVPWTPPVAGSADDADEEVRAAVRAHATLTRVPVELDLSGGAVVGLVGDRGAALALARSLVTQAAVHHGPADLGVLVCASEAAGADWDWVKWLPHTLAEGGERQLAAGRAAADPLLAGVLEEGRHAPARTRLLVIDDVDLLTGRRAPARLLLQGAGGPVAGIVVAGSADQLPAVTSVVITLRSELGDADLRRPQRGERIEAFVVCGMDEPLAREAARTIARYEDPEREAAGAGLPRVVRLPPLLGTDPPDVDAVLRQWGEGLPDPPPATPIGLGPDGPVDVDLLRDGPHGLVGGTTGAGKSELLRTLVAGMAARVDPDHLVFVLIDYKGGSAFDACARLPHTVGLVTDLDAHLGERALRSLEAELAHRERLLREAGAADLPAYLRAGARLGPLPRLLVAVDEFATLAAELPDFLGALVGVAQRGRSLGVHLLLATQRPSGAVNAAIKANTNLRIALRVQDAQDALDIVERREPAQIPRGEPGRAYLRRGHGDVVAVQTALATAVAPQPDGGPVALRPFGFAPAAGAGSADGGPGEGETDLERLVEVIRAAADKAGIAPPRRPWLPLPAGHMALAGLPDPDGDAALVPLGLADDPDRQRQHTLAWDPREGHLAVFGAIGSGTTTTLLTAALALAGRGGPDAVHIYGVDHGAGGLAPLAALPHVGGVVPAAAAEAQLRLLRRLRAELERRRALDAEARADLPRIVLLLDGIQGFLAQHGDLDGGETLETFRRVFAEGPEVGIVVALAGDRPAALPLRLAGQVAQRLVLRLADPADVAAIGLRPRQLPAFVPGRGVWVPSGAVVQVAHPGDVAAAAQALRERWPGTAAGPAPVATLPARLAFEELTARPRLTAERTDLPVGVRDDDLSPAVLTLRGADHALVAGPAGSGKTSALALLAALVREADQEAILVGVCDPRTPLFDVAALDAAGPLDELGRVLRLADHNPDRLWLVLVDDCIRVEDHEGLLAATLRSGRPRLHVVGAARPDDLRAAYTHWSRPLRQSPTGLLLQPALATDGDLLGVRLPRRVAVPLEPGRGFLVTGGTATLAQLALPPLDAS